MSQALLEMGGAQSKKQVAWGNLVDETFFEGLVTNRAPLHPAGTIVENKFYNGRPGALLGGKNIFLNNQLSLARRPGHSLFSSTTYCTTPLTAFTFPQLDGSVRVIIDTGSSGNLALTSVSASGGGVAVYHGTFPDGGSNSYVGLFFQVTGFTGSNNNGTWVCTASTTTTLTLQNTQATAETTNAIAVTSGGVWWDEQNGSKTFLYGKQPSAGQTGFTALAGILYAGDGVDTWSWNPSTTGTNGNIFAWGLEAPTAAPQITIVPSGSASVAWVASTMFTPMGLIQDASNHTSYQLISVNASTTNTTQLGSTGNGAPAFAAVGSTIVDNTITWLNSGPIVLWTANTLYQNASVGGNATSSCIIYDPKTKACYINANPGNASGTSGGTYPAFKAGAGQSVYDGTSGKGVKWFYLGTPSTSSGAPGIPGTWLPNHAYPKVGTVSNNDAVCSVVSPVGLLNGLPTNQPVYWQTSSGGTSGAGNISPLNASTAAAGIGTTVTDGDLVWLNLASSSWAATTPVSGWSAVGTAFTAIVDSNGNFQVCQTTGVTATKVPGSSYTLTAAQASTPSAGFTTYTYSSTTAVPVGNGALPLIVSGFSNAGNNSGPSGFTIVSSTATSVVVVNASGVNESGSSYTGIYNPWNAGYGNTTSDGTATFVCVGSKVNWTESQQWYLPAQGFYPPSSADPFGGASVIDSNSDLEFSVNPGISGGSAPSWGAIGTYTDDNGTSFTLSQVTVNADGTTTYTGTGLSGLAGQSLIITGFAASSGINNGQVVALSAAPWAPTATTFHVKTGQQINETHAGHALNGLQWYNLAAFSQNSLAWSFGISFAYSFKSRDLNDYYSTEQTTTSASGVTSTALPVPPGSTNSLTFPPPGSQIGDLSTTSPAYQITGSDAGAVITLTGLGSTNPAVDTIVIYASPDEADGSANMLEATEINAPQPIGGLAQPWTFKYFLPFTPATVNGVNYPGLDALAEAPIDGQNDPPPSGFVPFVYNFERIWGTYQNSVLFSQGPDSVGGNPNSQFLLADSFPFLANPTNIVKSTQGLLVMTPSSFEYIGGGPLTSSFFSVQLLSGLGVNSRNCVTEFGGEVFAFCSDNTLRIVNPQLNLPNAGMLIEDLFANVPITGIADATWNSNNVYVAMLQNGNDTVLAVGDGATGYYTLNPRQATGSMNQQDPVWSPFALVQNAEGGSACAMVCVVETSPGIRQMLVGSPVGGNHILVRNSSVFTDNGTEYDAYFYLGSLALARRGEIAICRFLECDFSGVAFRPTVSYLINEIFSSATLGSFVPFTLAPQYDPPSVYGSALSPISYSPNRYFFSGTGSLARTDYITLKVDFGQTSNADQIYSLTLNGTILKGQ